MTGRRQERKRTYKSGMIAVFLVVLLLFVVVMFESRRLKVKNNEYHTRIEALQVQLDSQNNIRSELKEYGKYTKTKKYVEEVAREKLGLVYPDEIIFKSVN